MRRTILAATASAVFTAGFGLSALADQPEPWGLWSQVPASPIMHRIVSLNAEITVIILAVVVFVLALLGIVVFRFRAGRNPSPAAWTHNTRLEVAWTLIPVLILVVIAFPSFRLLYVMDRAQDAEMTVKVIGHQWYWSYEYPDQHVTFDSNMIQDEDLKPGQPRLLAADNPVVLPANTVVRVIITSEDVIHSWSVPSLGLKTDAIPGRLNETWVLIEKPGTYYGQCSQLCGVNHGFMPIQIEALPKDRFEDWLKRQKTASAGTPERVAAAGRLNGAAQE